MTIVQLRCNSPALAIFVTAFAAISRVLIGGGDSIDAPIAMTSLAKGKQREQA
jgi:hypothetical protein